MDFGYKVIRNRLGSLVANAIQKKINSNKVLAVNVESNTSTIDSNVVIDCINNGKFVYYIMNNKQYANLGVVGSTVVIYNNSGSNFEHNGNTVSISGGDQA